MHPINASNVSIDERGHQKIQKINALKFKKFKMLHAAKIKKFKMQQKSKNLKCSKNHKTSSKDSKMLPDVTGSISDDLNFQSFHDFPQF